jgi:hypothetical protein
MRATYQRPHGVEHLLGFYDVHADCFAGVFVKRNDHPRFPQLLRRLRIRRRAGRQVRFIFRSSAVNLG